jgi:uncharacterized protein
MMIRFLGVLAMSLALMVGSATLAVADYDAGMRAAQAGDYATAFREWKPLAEQGDAAAQSNLGWGMKTVIVSFRILRKR